MESAVRCQNGDPLGPVTFSLVIHTIIWQINFKLNMWFLDDNSLRGNAETVLQVLAILKQHLRTIDLELNLNKSHLYS